MPLLSEEHEIFVENIRLGGVNEIFELRLFHLRLLNCIYRSQIAQELCVCELIVLNVFVVLFNIFDSPRCDFESCFVFRQTRRVDDGRYPCAFASFSKIDSMSTGVSHYIAPSWFVRVSEKLSRIGLNLIRNHNWQVECLGQSQESM